MGVKYLLAFALLYPICLFSGQQTYCDSLGICYEIVHMEFHQDYDVIKIKLPPYLSSAEVMEQIRKVIFWPDAPPPKKRTKIYVYRDTDTYGSSSKTGAVYIPGKGFLWDLRDWKPDSSFLRTPTPAEIRIYNTYLDTLLRRPLQWDDSTARRAVSQALGISRSHLDTVYFRVKWWLQVQKRAGRKTVKLNDQLQIIIK